MKQLLILSGKGGTGKTTLASAFIKISKAEAYADCDVDAPNLHLITNHTSIPETNDYYGLPKARIDNEKCSLCNKCLENCRFGAISFNEKYEIDYFACEGCGVCQFVCKYNAIKLLPDVAGELKLYNECDSLFSTARLKMGSGTSGKLVSQVKKQLTESKRKFEISIIDGSPGIGCPVIASISGADMILVVAEPSLSGISDMERVIDTGKKFGVEIAVCINKYDINDNISKIIEEYCRINNIKFVGKIPYDRQAINAINDGKTIDEIECIANKAVKKVYEKTMRAFLS